MSAAIYCEQCDSAIELPHGSIANRGEYLGLHRWEPYGIRTSVGVAAEASHDAYACPRCANEAIPSRVRRALDAILAAANVRLPYDVERVRGLVTVTFSSDERQFKIVVELPRKDRDLARALRTAFEPVLVELALPGQGSIR
jgi:hypothetical protein